MEEKTEEELKTDAEAADDGERKECELKREMDCIFIHLDFDLLG